MHDISMAKGILNAALKEAKGRKVLRIKIDLAEEGHLTKETLSEAFKLISHGTIAEGANLQINSIANSFAHGHSHDDLLETKILELEVEEE